MAAAKAKGAALGAGTDAARTPSVEVGSLEAVLQSMAEEGETAKPLWNEMVLVASSAAAAAREVTESAQKAVGGKEGKGKK